LKGTIFEDYMKAMYLSPRDCVGFFKQAIEVPIVETNGIPYMVCFACSNNTHKVWDMAETISRLKYVPLDSVDKFFG
jgi:hypothetical protein